MKLHEAATEYYTRRHRRAPVLDSMVDIEIIEAFKAGHAFAHNKAPRRARKDNHGKGK